MRVLRLAAFTQDPAGGNPAGVVLDATGADDAEMLRVAADVGYSETAFLVPTGPGQARVRYFSPQAEVPFCGHATIAASVAHAMRHGPGRLVLATAHGPVTVTSTGAPDGHLTATLVSVPPTARAMSGSDEAELLAALGWTPGDLDPTLPLRVAYAGAWHPIVAAGSQDRLADLHYDCDALGAIMAARGWTTVALVWRESAATFHARNPFPPGGIYEDPATGAAAAALGGYLRQLGLIEVPTRMVIHQGADLGRPSRIVVDVPEVVSTGIAVTGHAVPMARGARGRP